MLLWLIKGMGPPIPFKSIEDAFMAYKGLQQPVFYGLYRGLQQPVSRA
jgi:hypothetical protein